MDFANSPLEPAPLAKQEQITGAAVQGLDACRNVPVVR